MLLNQGFAIQLVTFLLLAQGSLIQPARAEPRAIFGDDNRVRVTNQGHPWRSIGKLTDSDGHFCTASLVSRCHLLTAAHCVIDRETHALKDSVLTFRSSVGTSAAYASHTWWGTGWPDENQSDDWAIIKLDRELGSSLGWFKVQEWKGVDDTVHTGMRMAGYSSDLYSGKALTADEKVSVYHTTAENILMVDANGSYGASGAGIWYFDADGNPTIIGVYTRSHDGRYTRYQDNVASLGVASAQFLPTLRKVLAQGCD